MTDPALPPVRASHTWRGPSGAWRYDTWGHHGRPILLIPAIMFDRTMWWPAAAELRPHATVIAVDLPGHGGAPVQDRYDPEDVVGELAMLLYRLGMRQAPIVVGHASAVPLAALFAARCPAHALVAVDPPGPYTPPVDPDQYVRGFGLDAVPAHYRDLVTPANDNRLLTAYADCTRRKAVGDPPAVGRPAHLALHSQPPPALTAAAGGPWRHHVYRTPGRFPHLTDLPRFAADIRCLL